MADAGQEGKEVGNGHQVDESQPTTPQQGEGPSIDASTKTGETAKRKKRSNRKKKKKAAGSSEGTAQEEAPVAPAQEQTLSLAPGQGGGERQVQGREQRLSQEHLASMIQQFQIDALRRGQRTNERREHRFWNTQPVPQYDEQTPATENGASLVATEIVSEPIEEKTVEDIDVDPLKLPSSHEWAIVDITDDGQLQEAYTLLTENYVEDDDNMFRFDYSPEFLRWALLPPHWNAQFHLGVRQKSNNSLVAFITGIPALMNVYGRLVRTVEINFLCVHKRLRSKRLAPVLIKEITRRVNLEGIFQAVYTAGVVLPRPVARCRYFHRSLNPRKLIEVGFSRLGERQTMSRVIKLYKLPNEPLHDFAAMEERDVAGVTSLLNEYLGKYKLHPVLDEAEVAHWLLPRENVVNSYVLRNEGGDVTDFVSFYHLPSSVIGNPKHSTLRAVYSYYNVATTLTLPEIMKDALIQARQLGADVFNALNLMENDSFLKDLKFGVGDGNLQYYLYNWNCTPMDSGDIGLVLL